MPLQAPILDDRNFQDLFAEARALIPRYAPEWTNHNESDPGIAMLQMFAWMTDVLIYRLNRVPERNYIKFLELLGIELQPRRPATTELTFRLSRHDIDHVIIPKSTQVSATEPDENGNVIQFETDRALVALGAELAAVQVFDAIGYSMETTANQAGGQSFYPFGAYARPGSSLMLGFRSPLPFTKQRIELDVSLKEAAASESVTCSLDLQALPLPAILVWEYWDGSAWKSLSLDHDETAAFSMHGHILLRGPGDRALKASIGNVPEPLYWIRCRLERSFYEQSPELDTILINTMRATQANTTADEILGGSNGRPHQRFFLANTPVVPLAEPQKATTASGKQIQIEYVRLEVSERPVIGVDLGFQIWEQVDDFEIAFGDGVHGRIPVANPGNPNDNIIARLYRSGGGKSGNVGANTLTNLLTFIEDVEGVDNFIPASGGSNEESLEAAKARAPLELKSRGRAVTTEDFEYYALQTPGVRVMRALALPLVHPQFKGVTVPGVVTVIVVPDSDSPRPTPNSRTLRAVCQCLNQHRLLTTEVFVIPPFYRKVSIAADIIARPGADLAAVRDAVENNLSQYLHPLKGGDDGLGWPFGQTIFYSRIYQVILRSEGVDRVENNQLEIFLDDEVQPFCRDVEIESGELLYTEEHDIRVSYGF